MVWLFVIMLILFAISVPIAWSMAIAAAVFMAFGPHVPLQGFVQRMIGGIDTFPLLAIPFFILAGNLMNTGGITDRLVRLAKAMVGEIGQLGRNLGLERLEAEFIGEQEAAIKMFALLGFSNLLRLEDYVKDMQAISHDYVLMGLNLKVDEEYAGVG